MALSSSAIVGLLEPYLPISGTLADQLALYLDLLLKWNARTNLTAIREPEEIVRRHFGESLFTGLHLPPAATLLDFGSGAGFPGLPIQLLRPELAVTLAESQNKKASFLREAVRTLDLRTEVWADRVERLPASRVFDVVTLRAVDKMAAALESAEGYAGQCIAVLGTGLGVPSARFTAVAPIRIPESVDRQLFLCFRDGGYVPRGTS